MLESRRCGDVQFVRCRLVLLVDFGVSWSVRVGIYFFMMSTRFQLEHTITRLIGIDADDGPDQGPLAISIRRLFHSLGRLGI